MFDNNSKVECFSYSIDLDKPIEFFCDLIFEIAQKFEVDFLIETLFKEEFISLIGLPKIQRGTDQKINYEYKDIISFAITYYNSNCLEAIDKLESSSILLVYKTKNLLFYYGDDKDKVRNIKSAFINYLKGYDILNDLCNQLSEGRVKEIILSLQRLNYNDYYNNIVTIKEKADVWAPYLPVSFFNTQLIVGDPIDSKDVWVNKKKFKKEFSIDVSDTENVFMIRSREEADAEPTEIGIQYDEIVFPITVDDVKKYMKEEMLSDYYWLLFKDVYKKSTGQRNIYNSSLLEEFKEDSTQSELNKLLSFLVNNHYLNDFSLIDDSPYAKYFESVSRINQLNHINDLEFYVSDSKGKTALGIYSNKKYGTSYNLLHWVLNDDPTQTQHFFRNEDKPEIKEQIKILALKPFIAFYFISKYFEDILNKVIAETTVDYIKNFELFIQNKPIGEIDFLIRTPSKIVFIEAKTKLTDEYIEQFITKCDTLIKSIDAGEVKAEFYIIGAYSDSTCERKRYFIDKEQLIDYNKQRNGLNTTPYFFKVPIPQHTNVDLTCIAEPEFEKLQTIIESICKE